MPVLKSELTDLIELFPDSKTFWDYETGNYIDINASKGICNCKYN